MPDFSTRQIWARDILLTNDCTAKMHSRINWNLVKSTLKGSIVNEAILYVYFGPVAIFVCCRFDFRRFELSPFWPYPTGTPTNSKEESAVSDFTLQPFQ